MRDLAKRKFYSIVGTNFDPRFWQCIQHQGFGKTWWHNPLSKTFGKTWGQNSIGKARKYGLIAYG